MPSEDHLLPFGLFWIGFDDRNISKSTSIRKDGSDFCAEGGLTVKLCRQPADGWLLNRPISDFTMETPDADACARPRSSRQAGGGVMSSRKLCKTCGEPADYGGGLCYSCHEAEQVEDNEKFNTRLDVMMLNAVDDLKELKEWIKEYLLK